MNPRHFMGLAAELANLYLDRHFRKFRQRPTLWDAVDALPQLTAFTSALSMGPN